MTRTSEEHPIEVGWLDTPWPGGVGLTFAPGKKQSGAMTGGWDRDLGTDLDRLRSQFGVDSLVCLLEAHELTGLQIEALGNEAEARGIQFTHFPIPDLDVPSDTAALQALVSQIVATAASGRTVVIHCKGGIGRSGTIGGCVARAAGMDGDAALAAVRAARGPNSPETYPQQEVVRQFVPGPPAPASRHAGAVLGAAIGDALGHPTEFVMSFEAIRATWPPEGVTGFEKWMNGPEGRFAPYTDDTQMAEVVLRTLLAHRERGLDATMTAMAAGFVEWVNNPQGGHRAPGNACMSGARELERGVHWREAGGPTAGGCGSVMRAYPFGLVFGHDPDEAEFWSVEHSHLTHRDPIALAACAAMARGVALELAGAGAEDVLEAMTAAAARHDAKTAAMAARAVDEALGGGDPEVTLDRLRGWAAHEAIAAAMYVVARHPADIRSALLEAANTPGDSDSIATLAGALLGARLGLESLPGEWVRDVERSKDLLELAAATALHHPG